MLRGQCAALASVYCAKAAGIPESGSARFSVPYDSKTRPARAGLRKIQNQNRR
jgi:hypothetical protein